MSRLAERLDLDSDTFIRPEDATPALRDLCSSGAAPGQFIELGESEEGRPITALRLGTGAHRVSLIAGNHSDEPVGPDFLRRFARQVLESPDAFSDLLGPFTFFIIPHTNPDGEAKNRRWVEEWPDIGSYLRHAFREPPGRDMEFGFPAMRKENGIVGDFLWENGPFALHMSLHGMGFGEGAMLLIERAWTFRTQALRDGFARAVRSEDLSLHDHNRKGEKGFFYLEPGFSTTPEGEAMRWFFRARGDNATAVKFHDSSMEFVRRRGGDPLCLVTELPIFVLQGREEAPPGVPRAYLRLREELPELRLRLQRGEDIRADLAGFDLRAVALSTGLRLQATTLELALSTVMTAITKSNI